MLGQPAARLGLVKLGRSFLHSLQSRIRLGFEAGRLPPQGTQQVIPISLVNRERRGLGTRRQSRPR